MADVPLSPRIKKLAKDFALRDGKYCLAEPKFKAWVAEFKKVPEADRAKNATELVALAIRFEREGGVPAARGAAQLYFFAAGLLSDAAKANAGSGWKSTPTKKPAAPAPTKSAKPPAKKPTKTGAKKAS